MQQLIESLLLETPLMIAIFDPSLKCDHLSRPWASIAGIRHNDETAPGKLGIAELFEPGSQVFVEHRIKTAFNKNKELIGVPANIHSQRSPGLGGTLAILPMNLKAGLPTAVAVIFNPESSSEITSKPDFPATVKLASTNRTSSNIRLNSNGTSSQNGNRLDQRQRNNERRSRKLNQFLADQIDIDYSPLVGQSNAARRIQEQVETIAQTNATVLIEGEFGTGKEAIARSIHRQGMEWVNERTGTETNKTANFSGRPFIKLNCCTIDENRFEAQLFGNDGILSLADGGTLFLKEVSAIPLVAQTKLLSRVRSLQIKTENQDTPAGKSPDEIFPFDIRIIASTAKNLQREVNEGRFSEHLFRRLNVFPISAPPLKERIEDILALTQHFVESNCRSIGRPPVTITNEQIRQLSSLPWPGNILELKSLIERAVLLSSGNHLRLDLVLAAEVLSWPHDRISEEHNFYTEAEFLKLERKNVLLALKFADWRVSGAGGAAELLGIKPSTLNYRMKKLNIVRSSDTSHSQ